MLNRTSEFLGLMNKLTAPESPTLIEDLLNHIQERTFGRLRQLSIVNDLEGRISVSATAHSQLICQLAEWAVLEVVSRDQVDLAISVRRPNSL